MCILPPILSCPTQRIVWICLIQPVILIQYTDTLCLDGQMKGSHVHILEKDPIPGGACDGYQYSDIGYVMRGGREMDNHFECMWDLFRSIPSISYQKTGCRQCTKSRIL